MNEDRLSMLALYALPLVPSLLVCVVGIALAIGRGPRVDVTVRTVVVVALVVDVVLLASSAALSLWSTIAMRDGTSAADVGRIFGLLSVPRSLLSAAVLGALVLVALRERPAAPLA